MLKPMRQTDYSFFLKKNEFNARCYYTLLPYLSICPFQINAAVSGVGCIDDGGYDAKSYAPPLAVQHTVARALCTGENSKSDQVAGLARLRHG